jgi:hypothetical protein
MNRLDSDIVQYINDSPASYHIKFYINQGIETNRAIRKGWEEAYEELLEKVYRYERKYNIPNETIKEENDKTF